MAWYRSGTVTVNNGDSLIVGAGTAFLTNVKAGDIFVGKDNLLYEIDSVVSTTQLTIKTPYLGASVVGASYEIIPTSSYLKSLASQVTDLIALYSAVPQNAIDAQNAATQAQGYRDAAQAAQQAAKESSDSAAAALQSVQAEVATIPQTIQKATQAAVDSAQQFAQQSQQSAESSSESATTATAKAGEAAQSASDASASMSSAQAAMAGAQQAKSDAEAARDAAQTYSQVAKPLITSATLGNFPTTGDDGKGYVAADTGSLYRWDGGGYVEVSPKPRDTDEIAEGHSRLYFTNGRVLDAISESAGDVRQSLGVYAAQDVDAAIASRTPWYSADKIPTENNGPIEVVGIGQMDWNAAVNMYLPLIRFAECRLDGGTVANSIKLSRYGGCRLTVGDDTLVIPESGIQLTLTGLTAGTVYNVFGYKSVGALALEYGSGTAWAHAPDPYTGTHVKFDGTTYDRSRTFLGMFYCNGSSQVVDSSAQRGVASFYNRVQKFAFGNNGGMSTASTSFIQGTATSGLIWAGTSLFVALSGIAYANANYGMNRACLGSNNNPIVPVSADAQSTVPNHYVHLSQSWVGLSTVDQFFVAQYLIASAGGAVTTQAGYVNMAVWV